MLNLSQLRDQKSPLSSANRGRIQCADFDSMREWALRRCVKPSRPSLGSKEVEG
jgi:hypothetical protein